MIRKPLNQLQITAQASSFLAGLAKECKMAIRPSKSAEGLRHELVDADKRANILRTEWEEDKASLDKLKAYERVLERICNLEAHLHEAKLLEDYLNQSV